VQLVVTSSNGCKDSISRLLTVFPKPIPAFAQPANQCLAGNSFTFNNTSTGAATYYWTFGDGNTSTNSSPTHTYSNAGNFTVKLIVANLNGCKDSTTRSFNVNQSPNISIQNNYSICLGDSIQLSTLGAQTYQWYPSQGLSCSVCPNPVAIPTANTTYTLTGLSNLGCISNAVVNIIVRLPIKILVSPNKAICGKSSTNLFAVGATSYVWSPAVGLSSTTIANPVASPDTTTTYMVIGYDANNCFKDTGYVKITVHPIPAIELGPDVTLSTGTIYPILPQTISGPIVSWAWTPAINLSCTNCPNPFATVKFDITYRAVVKNIYGCTAIDTLRIHTLCKGSQVFVPNAFTPDGDGRNDMLVVRSAGINAIRSFKIYSRWGELLFEKYNFPPNNPTYGWDGKIKGQAGSAEVYVYILEVTCDNNEKLAFKGNISILN
ncbi:MAG: gliding motility-associated C-terminal domain-containing protein, partial [Ferruginibacter sp.]|nr:gliding motility-associated C-terminal domain-containing protein [Ferruginibacter sp.]